MKKFTAILLTVLMIASLFISCENKITPVSDETVSVSFDESTSRSLTASLEEFNKDNYFWRYAAQKTDNTGLISGQTLTYDAAGSKPVKSSGTGLGSVPGFSQGSWKFMLFAYEDQSYTKLVYCGENLNVVLKKGNGNENSVTVQVSPIKSGEGTLTISNSLVLNPQKTNEEFDSASFTKNITIKTIGDPVVVKYSGTNTEHKLDAGSYLVQVDFVKNDIIYASGSVVATVFSNMTTTVGGYLDELITHADFDSEINPDVMNRSVYSNSIDKASLTDDGITISKKDTTSTAETDQKISATVTKDAVFNAIDNAIAYASNNGVSNATEANTTVAFELKVNTTNATPTSLEYEIGMNALITVAEGENTYKQLTQDVSEFNDYVSIVIDIQKGLSNVIVKHDNNSMFKLNGKDATFTDTEAPYGAYYYDATAGKLYIKTKSFSPFSVKYDEVKYIAEMNDVKYSSVQDAINAAPKNALNNNATTIRLITNVTNGPSFGFPDSMANKGKNICIDLNGNTYTFKDPAMGSSGTESQAMHLAYGNKLSLKNGTINVSSKSQRILMLIMNYCDLTLEDVVVDCSNVKFSYNNSICRGSLTLKGNTNLIASSNTAKIFDVDGTYGSDVSVVFDETYTGTTSGDIEYVASTGTHKSELTIKSGTFNGNITSSGSTKPSIIGGTFTFDPSEYVANGYNAKEENGKWIVSEIISLWDGTATENWDINEDGKYHITSAADLKAFADMVNNGTNFKDKTVVLETGINLNGKEWTPIGQNSIAGYPRGTFSGIFDGGNHIIKNLKVNASGEFATAGLFGSANRATIKNVVIDNATINSTHYAGGILGYETEKTTISDCVVKNSKIMSAAEDSTGVWDNGDKVGGIVGYMNIANIKNCSVNSTTLQGYRDIGGIIGYAGGGSVSGCSINGVTIKVDKSNNYKNYSSIGEHDANDIVGEPHGTIEGCTGTASISFQTNT